MSSMKTRRGRRAATNATRRRIARIVLAGALASAVAAPVWGAELPLRRVILSSIGLAQFTHSGQVTGGTTVALPVRLDQVDDMLKSLTVFDRAGGVGAVSLPGKAPLTELFRDLPFGPKALESPSALLNALVGSEVEIAGQVAAKGRIFRVQPEEVALPNNGGTVTRHRLSLMTDRGLVQAILEDVTSLRFTDPVAKAQIDRALAGLTQNRAKDRRELSLGVLGSGNRTIALSYVVSAPVWKTSYRLVVPRDGAKARLQGWAVVENLTGGDWKDIDLVLVSGNPVALRQSLYTAFFSDRPEIPVVAGQRLLPRRDDQDGMVAPQRRSRSAAKSAPRFAAAQQADQRGARPVQIPAPVPAAPAGMAPAAETLGEPAMAAEAEDATTQLLYRFPAKVSLATGHTMMVTFIDREVAAQRTWLYQPETHARRPLAAIRVRNDGESGLPGGILTAFESSVDGTTSFIGDAQLPLLSKGAVKFVTLALDSKTDIRRDDLGVRQTTLGKAVNGELTITTRSRRTIGYEVTPPADEDRDIIVEEARDAGWSPASGMQGIEETPSRFRFRVSAPKGKTTKAELVLERTDRRTVLLTSLGAEEIHAIVQGLENESPALREAVTALGGIIGDISKATAQRGRLAAERKRIADDQERIRRNLQSVGSGSDLGRRYLDALKSQEDRLAAIGQSEQALDAEIAAKRRAAEDVARRLTL